jgi:predicted nucleic acid-binding protein
MSLIDDIPVGAVVGLDTPVFIYFIEAHPDYGPIVEPLVRTRITPGHNVAVTSPISLAEVLVQPLRVGRADLVLAYRALLTGWPNIALRDITPVQAEMAADLRARYGIDLTDACQLAAALADKATVFVTNDAQLRRVTELTVLILSDYLPPAPAPAVPPTSP